MKKSIAIIFIICMTLLLSFSYAESLTSLNLTMTGYELGNKVKDVKVTADSPNVVIKRIIISKKNFRGLSDELPDSTTLEAGIGYILEIFLEPKDSATDFSKLSNKKIALNGEIAHYFYKQKEEPYYGSYKIVQYLSAFKADEYNVTILGGNATINGKPITKAKPGDTVTVTLDESQIPSGLSFDYWRADNSWFDISEYDETFSFKMLEYQVTINAFYAKFVKEINISNVVAPVAGQKVQDLSTINRSEGIYFTSDSRWLSEGAYMTASTYGEHKKYKLKLELHADTYEGYTFFHRPEDYILDHITVNGKAYPKADMSYNFSYDRDKVVIYLDFETGEKPPEQETSHEITILIYDYELKDYNTGGGVFVTFEKTSEPIFESNKYTIKDGTSVNLRAMPSEGYEFFRWQSGTGKQTTTLTTDKSYTFITENEDMTLQAIFAKEEEKVEVTTKPEGPVTTTMPEEPVTTTEPETTTKPEPPETTEPVKPLKTKEPVIVDNPEEPEPTKVVPKPTIIPREIYYEVEFVTNGGTKIEDIEVKSGDTIEKPSDPKKEGYDFDGWYANKKLTQLFNFETKINNDYILYAKWTEVKNEEPIQKIVWAEASNWAVAELNKANELGVIPSIFSKEDLTQNITRKEFAHVAVKLYENISGSKVKAIANNPFTDTKDEEVLKAYNVGITLGTSETTFDPDSLITREQMATMMTRALTKIGIDATVDLNKVKKFDDDAEMHDWGKPSIYYMSSIEIIKGMGDGTFGVLGNATREQALLISERSANKFAK